jgi:hypothetical protein
VEVWFGGSSTSKEWANKRTEMWADLRDWLGGGCIDTSAFRFHKNAPLKYLSISPGTCGYEKTKPRNLASYHTFNTLSIQKKDYEKNFF